MQMGRNGNIAMPGRRVAGVPPPQFEFFFVGDEQVVTPLDFGNYEQEIRTMLDRLGAHAHMDVPQLRKTLAANQIHDIKYDPKLHIRDRVLYREMIQGNGI